MVGKGRWDVGACHEEGVALPSFALPGEKTSGQTKVKGQKLQKGQFWKFWKPRMVRRCLLQIPAHCPMGATWGQAEYHLLWHHLAARC